MNQNMENKLLLIMFVVLASFLVLETNCEGYTTKFDNIDIDEILNSERLLKNYLNCLLDKGNCAPDANELKRVLPDAIQTDCSKCSEKQREGSKKIIRFLIDHKPDWWKELEAKYDPDGYYFEKHKADIGL